MYTRPGALMAIVLDFCLPNLLFPQVCRCTWQEACVHQLIFLLWTGHTSLHVPLCGNASKASWPWGWPYYKGRYSFCSPDSSVSTGHMMLFVSMMSAWWHDVSQSCCFCLRIFYLFLMERVRVTLPSDISWEDQSHSQRQWLIPACKLTSSW